MGKIIISAIAFYLLQYIHLNGQTVDDFYRVVSEKGKPPVEFIAENLKKTDLIIFDDALHNALEPFDFYSDLLTSGKCDVDILFLEIISIASQPHLDAYFSSPVKDSTVLLKVFQDDFSGYGLRYQTYLDILSDIWDYNRGKPQEDRIRVVGVNQPVYWEGINSREDYLIFYQSLVGRDYFMYRIISGEMQDFSGGIKGVFLTNTRHAYKNIKKGSGKPYWNTGTFFYKWHPGKTFSVRIHNATLFIESATSGKRETIQGMEKYTYSWRRMENGLWDRAFALNGNVPVAIPLEGNVFGSSDYIGNHMLDVIEGQKMQDAYDALIFLKPLEELHFSALTDFFYTPEFKKELARRIEIIEEGNMEEFLKQRNAISVEEFIERTFVRKPVTENNLIKE
ncbi:MAG: hypothetical protein LC649_11125 [Bacteroidales bacterium]|nr:hypothetical protein [Bacteroidales bacterium]